MTAAAATTLPPWLQRQLDDLVSVRAHAVLLAGPSGLGQYPLALALARTWLCERPGPHGACGTCHACHAVAVRTHPDLRVLMPEALAFALGWPLDPSVQKELDEKKRKPSRQIRVEAVREAVAFTQMTGSRARAQVVLVHPAEALNTESANALLKTLEEPGPAVRFVLATAAAEQLLPTVRSRCLTHTLHWPQPAEALAWVRERAGARQADAASTWLRAAGGRPDDALAWAEEGLDPSRWAALPRQIAQGDAQGLAGWASPRQLDVLQKLCHDLMAVAVGALPRYFEPNDLPSPPPLPRLAAWARELMTAARTIDHPFSGALLTEAWVAHAALLWRAEPRRKASSQMLR